MEKYSDSTHPGDPSDMSATSELHQLPFETSSSAENSSRSSTSVVSVEFGLLGDNIPKVA